MYKRFSTVQLAVLSALFTIRSDVLVQYVFKNLVYMSCRWRFGWIARSDGSLDQKKILEGSIGGKKR